MATLLEGCTTAERRSAVPLFLWATGLSAKDMFTAYGGKYLSRKAVHNGVEKLRWKVADDVRPGAEVAETVRGLLCCGFRRTGKAMGQEFQCRCWTCREIYGFSPRFKYHMFYIHL
jgi:hypothetical protein